MFTSARLAKLTMAEYSIPTRSTTRNAVDIAMSVQFSLTCTDQEKHENTEEDLKRGEVM
jgi:hypothetical protein